MFSTKLTDNRCYVPCIVMTTVPIVHSFIVDTGAKYTCCSYKNIDCTLTEADFANAEQKTLGGIVSGAEIIFYKYTAAQFTVGNVDMGSRDIWVTFDQLATDDVLGMDILKDLYFVGHAGSQTFIFYQSEEEFLNRS